MSDIDPVLRFLYCRSPAAWAVQAAANLDTLLLDHASLELKAAQQALKLIRKYAAARNGAWGGLNDAFRGRLAARMSRLAREELRHFEQVVALIERRGGRFAAVSPSRYAAGMHSLARRGEPGALVDALIIGAVIEARSCERFSSLLGPVGAVDGDLARFYGSLLKAEARHFEDYLGLAEAVAPGDLAARIEVFLSRDAELVESPDVALRFLSGPVAGATASQSAGKASIQPIS
jgi:tRNA-(ms[2]io[6]A)-hydroxylase